MNNDSKILLILTYSVVAIGCMVYVGIKNDDLENALITLVAMILTSMVFYIISSE